MKKLLMLVLMFCFALIGCSDSGGGSSKKKNPCDGPVPCLTEKWGVYLEDGPPWWSGRYAIFYDGDDPILLISTGEIVEVDGMFEIEGETYLIGLVGPVLDCYNAQLNYGAVDYDLDGIPDYEFTSVSGHLRVCGQTLSIYDIVVEGEVYEDVVATYDSMASLSASNHLITDAPISAENVEKVKIMIKVLEQLMEK